MLRRNTGSVHPCIEININGNGCSELFAAIWGTDNGVGVRSAVGMSSLPGNIPVEIEAVFKLHA